MTEEGYFSLHQNQLVYIGAARDIQKRIDDGHHHIRYLLKDLLGQRSLASYADAGSDHYPGETVEIRYYEHLSDWQELINTNSQK